MALNPWFGLIDASVEAAFRTFEAMVHSSGASSGAGAQARQDEWLWTTPNRITAEMVTMRVREFTKSGAGTGPSVIVVAPYALHAATTVDFAHGHSVVEALLQAGIGRVILTDWRSAGEEQRYLAIDSYLAELNALVDDVGAPVALCGLCQGGVLAAIYAARFPHKVSRMALVGAPLDLEAGVSLICEMVQKTSPLAVESLIWQGRGIVRAALTMSLWSTTACRESDIRAVLQIEQVPPFLLQRFASWNQNLIDLPGTFYRETVDRIFRSNAFAHGEFMALGRKVGLAGISCPLFLLAAAQDEIVSPQQVLGAVPHVSTRPDQISSLQVDGRHLSLFMGHHILEGGWPQIAEFLSRTKSGTRKSQARSASALIPQMEASDGQEFAPDQ